MWADGECPLTPVAYIGGYLATIWRGVPNSLFLGAIRKCARLSPHVVLLHLLWCWREKKRISTHALCMSLESPSYNFTADEKKRGKSGSNTAVLFARLALFKCNVNACAKIVGLLICGEHFSKFPHDLLLLWTVCCLRLQSNGKPSPPCSERCFSRLFAQHQHFEFEWKIALGF